MLKGNGLLADAPLTKGGVLSGKGLPPKQPPGSSSLAPRPRETNMAITPETMGQIQAEASQVATKGMQLLHGPETRGAVLNNLKNSTNLVQAVADQARETVKRVESAAREKGLELNDVAKIMAGRDLIGEIAAIASRGGLGDLDEADQTLAFSVATQDYMREGIDAGRLNPSELQEAMKANLGKLPKDQLDLAQKTALEINKTADKWKDRDPLMAGPNSPLGQSSNEVA